MDDDQAVEAEVHARLHEQRRVGHGDPGTAGRLPGGPSRLGFADPRVNDRVQAVARGGVPEHDLPEDPAIDAALRVENLPAKSRHDVLVGRPPEAHDLVSHAVEVQRRHSAGGELGENS